MRMARKNKRILWYATFVESEPIYVLDADGNKIVVETINGVDYYQVEGQTDPHYSDAVEIAGTILYKGNNVSLEAYGLNTSDYDAVLVLEGNSSPIDEQTVIWVNSKPSSTSNDADYTVVRKSISLNTTYLVLKKVVS